MIDTIIYTGKTSCRVVFPTTQETLKAALEEAGIRDFYAEGCKIWMNKAPVKNLYSYLNFKVVPDELQYIAQKIKALSADECKLFEAFLELGGFDDDSVKTVIDALENLECLSLDTGVTSVEEYGRNTLSWEFEDSQSSINRLKSSEDLSDGNLLQYIETLENFMNYEKYGFRCMSQNDTYLTSNGLLGVNWREFFWSEDRSIPEEFRFDIGKRPATEEKPSVISDLRAKQQSIHSTIPRDKNVERELYF